MNTKIGIVLSKRKENRRNQKDNENTQSNGIKHGIKRSDQKKRKRVRRFQRIGDPKEIKQKNTDFSAIRKEN